MSRKGILGAVVLLFVAGSVAASFAGSDWRECGGGVATAVESNDIIVRCKNGAEMKGKILDGSKDRPEIILVGEGVAERNRPRNFAYSDCYGRVTAIKGNIFTVDSYFCGEIKGEYSGGSGQLRVGSEVSVKHGKIGADGCSRITVTGPVMAVEGNVVTVSSQRCGIIKGYYYQNDARRKEIRVGDYVDVYGVDKSVRQHVEGC